MWTQLDLEKMATEENAYEGPRTAEEVEQIVSLARLELYNRGLPCGAVAVRNRLDALYQLKPLPSTRTIGHILARNGLTDGRTGWYEGDQIEWAPATSRGPKRSKQGV
jgi:hypothetical protein